MKRLLRTSIIFCFSVCLLLFALVVSLNRTATPETVIASLSEADPYSAYSKDFSLTVGSEGSIDTQGLSERIFTPELVKTELERAVDEVFAWLSGESESLQFTFSFEQRRALFEQELTDREVQNYSSLAECAPGQTSQASPDATCRSPFFSEDSVRQSISENFSNNQLNVPEYALDSRKFDERIAVFAPKVFQVLRILPVFIAVIITVLTAALMIVYAEKYRSFKKISNSLLSAAVFIFVAAFVTSRFVVNTDPAGSSSQLATKEVYDVLIRVFTADLYAFGTLYAVLGLIMFIIAQTLYRRGTRIEPNETRASNS